MPDMERDLTETRSTVVAGASRGLGGSIAKELAAHSGAYVESAARTLTSGSGPFEGGIADAVEGIPSSVSRAVAIVTELTRPDAQETLIARFVDELGPYLTSSQTTLADIFASSGRAAASVQPHIQSAGPGCFSPGAAGHSIDEIDETAPPGLDRQYRLDHVGTSGGASAVVARGTVCGMCRVVLQRLSSGAAAELYGYNIVVNSLTPNRVVPTPGSSSFTMSPRRTIPRLRTSVSSQKLHFKCVLTSPPSLTERNARVSRTYLPNCDLVSEANRLILAPTGTRYGCSTIDAIGPMAGKKIDGNEDMRPRNGNNSNHRSHPS